jgi:hypothetical protein
MDAIDGWKMGSFIRSAFECSMAWNVPLRGSCLNPIAAFPNRPCLRRPSCLRRGFGRQAYGGIAKTMASALLNFLNPELPNPET